MIVGHEGLSEATGVPVPTLKEWQKRGYIPRAVRRWHDGAVRALYDDAIVDQVNALKAVRRYGRSLERVHADMNREMAKR